MQKSFIKFIYENKNLIVILEGASAEQIVKNALLTSGHEQCKPGVVCRA